MSAPRLVIRLAKSGREVVVPDGLSILDALEEAGLDPPSSCRGGSCGTCETTVLEGDVEHRDSILSAAERRESKTMMICCSLSRGTLLVLDL